MQMEALRKVSYGNDIPQKIIKTSGKTFRIGNFMQEAQEAQGTGGQKAPSCNLCYVGADYGESASSRVPVVETVSLKGSIGAVWQGMEGVSEIQARLQGNGIETVSDDLVTGLPPAKTATTSCTYPAVDPEEGEERYLTFYSPDGIYCRIEGKTGYEWGIDFEEEIQYEKVMEYLESLGLPDNLPYGCNESFWRDFLADQIDMEGFHYYLDTRVANGVLCIIDESDDGTGIDWEALKYAKYIAPRSFANIIATTSEEFFQWQDEQLRQAQEEYFEKIFAENPQLRGRQIVYDGFLGAWRAATAEEEIWFREADKAFEKYKEDSYPS